MPGLYIASSQPKAGKTLLSCSLGLLLQERGYKVGYMKPLGSELKRVEAGNGDSGALVVQEILGQEVTPEELTPVMQPAGWPALMLTRNPENTTRFREDVRKAYANIAQNKDITLVAGSGFFPGSGSFAGIDGLTIINDLDLNVLLVERYDHGINFDTLLFMRNVLGGRLLGVVLNDIPESEYSACENLLKPYLEAYGIAVLGIIPHCPELNLMRCIDLAYQLKGRIVAGNSNASHSVGNFLIGTMQVENFMIHLRSNPFAAVIVGGDRADLQLTALHGQSPCLILTGNIGPNELVRAKAEEMGVPVIVVKEDSYRVARRMARILKEQTLNEPGQINRGMELVKTVFALDELLDNWFSSSES